MSSAAAWPVAAGAGDLYAVVMQPSGWHLTESIEIRQA
jgi:hypothetical protein